jgi:hypothetical protein
MLTQELTGRRIEQADEEVVPLHVDLAMRDAQIEKGWVEPMARLNQAGQHWVR